MCEAIKSLKIFSVMRKAKVNILRPLCSTATSCNGFYNKQALMQTFRLRWVLSTWLTILKFIVELQKWPRSIPKSLPGKLFITGLISKLELTFPLKRCKELSFKFVSYSVNTRTTVWEACRFCNPHAMWEFEKSSSSRVIENCGNFNPRTRSIKIFDPKSFSIYPSRAYEEST